MESPDSKRRQVVNVFDGFMKVPAKTYSSKLNPEFTGDWSKSDTRYRIFNKPRKYKITMHLFNAEGDKAVETVDVKEKLDRKGLSNLVYEQINRMISEYPTEDIDLIQSYLIIRV